MDSPTKGASKADALLASCGGLRTLELGMRFLGLRVKAPGYGRILANG